MSTVRSAEAVRPEFTEAEVAGRMAGSGRGPWIRDPQRDRLDLSTPGSAEMPLLGRRRPALGAIAGSSGSRDGEEVNGPEAILVELTRRLAASPSGLAFVYEALDILRLHGGPPDAVIVAGTPDMGQQAFRTGRRPLDSPWAREVASGATCGVFVDGGARLDPLLTEGIVGLCEIALRLDALDHDASHDALTGLLNRRCFDTLLAQALSRSQRYGWSFSLVMLDLNSFKALNDRLGHGAGDQVLRRIGAVLRRSLRAGDVAARIGGDEFAVLVTRADAGAGEVLADRLSSQVNAELEWAAIGFAVGVATAPTEAVDADELSRLADARLYEAKAG